MDLMVSGPSDSTVDMVGGGKKGRRSLNHLSAREWVLFSKSWFVLSGKPDRAKLAAHPATFPGELATEFIEFFTRRGEVVLDPFSGTGTTLVVAGEVGRGSVGIELEASFIEFCRTRTGSPVHNDDALGALSDVEKFPDGSIDYIFTSPPYMNALWKSRGGNRVTRHKERSKRGEPLVYGKSEVDLGNVGNREEYIRRLVEIFGEASRVLKPRRYCTVVLQNLNSGGSMVPVAWEFGLAMAGSEVWDMKGERIWCQENKKLGIYGYPTAYATNNFHHYCLTFRKVG